MIAKITSKRQVTFPASVLESLGLSPGDRIEIRSSKQGFLLVPRKIDRTKLAPLRQKLKSGKGTFSLERFRQTPHEPSLRD